MVHCPHSARRHQDCFTASGRATREGLSAETSESEEEPSDLLFPFVLPFPTGGGE